MIHISWTLPHIYLQERMAQIMYKMPLYSRRKFYLHFLLHGKLNKRDADVFVTYKMFALYKYM